MVIYEEKFTIPVHIELPEKALDLYLKWKLLYLYIRTVSTNVYKMLYLGRTEAVRVKKSPHQTPATHTAPSLNFHVRPGSVQSDSFRSKTGVDGRYNL